MKLVNNTGSDRVIDELRKSLVPKSALDVASPAFSLFAFAELRDYLEKLEACHIVLPMLNNEDLGLTGSVTDRIFRNNLQLRWLAQECADWIKKKVDLRISASMLPQSVFIAGRPGLDSKRVITGNCPFTTEGLGITPGNQFSLIQCSENPEESAILGTWFANLWNSLADSKESKQAFLDRLMNIAEIKAPSLVYYLILFHIFKDVGDQLDEERVVKSATGIRNTIVWKKLFKFQRDGVIGAIDKLERLGGCIIADSVGLGKTFEALAIIKYYELRNDRVLVLVPKRLRDNWTLYKANDRRNFLASDRFNYDVLNHTDLSRNGGTSGDIDLAHINWGNYDLVVIDESHNFRNKSTHNDRETRYDRLMRRIIKEGVKTRVLMLSATPVNNRLADLKNQISFVTESDDIALINHGISSIEATVRQAQLQFNRWLALEEHLRRPSRLIDMLGFDYFKLLDLLTIARSRKHIEKYYGIDETGRFPERLKPINIKPDVDIAGEFRSIREINDEIRRLNLAAYAPLRYVLPHKQAAYDIKYSTQIRGGESYFRQVDREESLVHLLRVNVLKRMESSVNSFALTLTRQLADVKAMLEKIEAQTKAVEEIDIEDVDIDDSAFESLLVGRKVKVLLQDVDLIRWKQDLIEDRNRLATLLSAAQQIEVARDAKLLALKNTIEKKCQQPFNTGNKKVLVFTAFADTAHYLYQELSSWALNELGLHSALVTGAGHNQTTLPKLRKDFTSIISSFSPCSKERPEDLADEGEIDLLIATDCISEGQNLQDCDTVINYDIHWNPVRIIQRFGRIDRIGSPNTQIQLINFWPNMELEEYINLEQRVSGRMVLLDISATGEENIIEHQSGNQMNDLEYRRKQLLKLQDTVIDLEDLSSGVSITDLTLNDFRIDLSDFLRDNPGKLDGYPFGTMAVTITQDGDESAIPPGIIFCLRAEGEAAVKNIEPGYPLAPYYIVHIGEDGTVNLPHTQAKQVLDNLKRTCYGRDLPDAVACAQYDKLTKKGQDMNSARGLLSKAVASIVGKKEERSVASLFTPGGTHVMKGEVQGINDFEVVAFLVVLPEVPRK
ncbi:helicase-related protein [Dehalococcoides mccartyi]|uniref:helicase-related protein n=2 Tax=Dehalococcoides mccartyi TaxID=61435 RepID=UPI0002B773D5|nr:helicase-related protein [Dehalococcoides mccartyi]AGG05703.1 DEAD-like helicase superfamily protein [Dehalococcoides mccartyi DCMB5]AGG07271.1 DEAD-like helicase superfamily protein [Dehalococcoides mccartyi BTF08]AOV98755.1 DEAD/DEAHbox helicase-like protein [Dehalococcoides mccartyi]AQU05425.1 helicase [Dehalococcoides mccartyi]